MTTATLDVNEAFARERAEQQATVEAYNAAARDYNAIPVEQRQAIADATNLQRFEDRVAKGELVPLGGGRYQSTGGWDFGEIWTLRKSPVTDRALLAMPEHGLDIDELTGRAKLYAAVPAWHGLGTVIPGGISDIDTVIRLGGLDVPAVTIPAPDYTIDGLGTFPAPGKFYIANGSTGEFWGVVGKVHRNVSPRVSFEFMEDLLGEGVVWESAGVMGAGRRVFISAKVPGGVTVDVGGINDYSELFLVVQDARDGSGAYWAMITPWRPLCQNTNRFAMRDAVSRAALRHTTGLPDRIAKTRITLGLSLKYQQVLAEEETKLARTEATIDEFRETMAELFAGTAKKGSPSGRVYGDRKLAEESKRTKLANNRREEDLEARFATEKNRVGSTLYAAEQAYTGYLDWGKTRKGDGAAGRWKARIEASLAGDDDIAKTRAHAKLMLRVR